LGQNVETPGPSQARGAAWSPQALQGGQTALRAKKRHAVGASAGDEVAGDVGRFAAAVRSGREKGQPWKRSLLARVQTPLGCGRWSNPHQCRADVGLGT